MADEWDRFPDAVPPRGGNAAPSPAPASPRGDYVPAAASPILVRPEDITPEDIEAAKSGRLDQGGRPQFYSGPYAAAEDRIARERARGSADTGAAPPPSSRSIGPIGQGYSIDPDGTLVLHIGGRQLRPIDRGQAAAAGIPTPPPSPPGETYHDPSIAPREPFPTLPPLDTRPAGFRGEEAGPAPEKRGFLAPRVTPRGSTEQEYGWPNIVKAPFDAAKTLMSPEGQYQVGEQDPEGVRLGAQAASAIPTGSVASAAAGAIPENTLGTIIGRIGASRLARIGEPVPAKLFDMIDSMEAQGSSYNAIRDATNDLIKREAPGLRGVEKGKDGEWRVELSDHDMRLRQMPQSGQPLPLQDVVDHPGGLFRAYPELNGYSFELVPASGAKTGGQQLQPGDAFVNHGAKRIRISDNTPPERIPGIIVHELVHAAQRFEGFANGSDPNRIAPYFPKDDNYLHPVVAKYMGKAKALAKTNPTPENLERVQRYGRYEAYYRQAGEAEARVGELRKGFEPQLHRNEPPRATAAAHDIPYSAQRGYGKASRNLPGADQSRIARPPSIDDEFMADLERQGYGREQAIERLNQGPAKAQTAAQKEQLAREDALGRQAGQKAKDASTLVKNLKANGVSSQKIAARLEQRFGTKVDPADVESGKGWWNAAAPSGPHRWTAETAPNENPWTPAERDLLKKLYRQGLSTQEILDRIEQLSGRKITSPAVRSQLRRMGEPPRNNMQEKWPREANLALAQMVEKGGKIDAERIARELSKSYGNTYSAKDINQQIERLRLMWGPSRRWGASVEAWQPDALAILKSPEGQAMGAKELADRIYRETGQVTSKAAVQGKRMRLQEEKARAELAEDLARARSAPKLKASGAPLPSSGRDQDRSTFWGNYL